jgi:hypothetical protein
MTVGSIVVTLTFDDPDAATGKFAVRLPKGAQVIVNATKITEVFNAGSTNVLTVGYGASLNEFIASGDVDETALGWTAVDRANEVTLTEEKDIYVKFVETGDAATTGSVDYVLTWIY